MTVKTKHTAPTYSGGDFVPPTDNTYSLGTTALSWKDLNVQTVVYATSVAGSWSPSADDTYDLGTSSYEWRDLYIDGVIYADEIRQDDNEKHYFGSSQDTAIYFDGTSITIDVSSGKAEIDTTGTVALTTKASNDGTLGCVVQQIHATTSPANNDWISVSEAIGRDSNLNSTTYGKIVWKAINVSDGAEEGQLRVDLVDGGSPNSPAMTLSGAGQLWLDDSLMVPIIYGDAGTYLRIGDATTTSHSLASEVALMVTIELEVEGKTYCDGGLTLGEDTELTISSGAITVTSSFHRVDTEGDAATDDLDTINGGKVGQILVLRSTNSTKDTTVKHATGNIYLKGATVFTFSHQYDTLVLLYEALSNRWIELSRSDNL